MNYMKNNTEIIAKNEIEDKSEKSLLPKYLILSHFILLIIAVISMTLNHVGLFLFYENQTILEASFMVGRVAFPLFAFMAVQGVYKSSNNLNYALRLLVLGFAIDLVAFIAEGLYVGNVMVELGLGVLALSLVNRKDKFSFLAILPAALMIMSDFENIPFETEYGSYGLVLMVAFYYAEQLGESYLTHYSNTTKVDENYLREKNLRKYQNLAAIILLVLIGIVYSIYGNMYPNSPFIFMEPKFQDYAIFAGVFIFFYSGKQGFHNMWTQGIFYLYYPLHIALLYAIAFIF